MSAHGSAIPNSATAARMGSQPEANHGLAIDDYTIETLNHATGGLFSGDDEWTADTEGFPIQHAEVAELAGGGTALALRQGISVRANSVFTTGRETDAVEFETTGPHEVGQYLIVDPHGFGATNEDGEGDEHEFSVTLDALNWGDQRPDGSYTHEDLGLSMLARTCYAASNWGIEEIALGEDTEPAWAALNYSGNPGTIDTSTGHTEDMEDLRATLAEHNLPDPWTQITKPASQRQDY